MNLEQLLRDRLTGADPRALIAALDIDHDRVFLHFGAIGSLGRVSFAVKDDAIWLIAPARDGSEPASLHEARTDFETLTAEVVGLRDAHQKVLAELTSLKGTSKPAAGADEGGAKDEDDSAKAGDGDTASLADLGRSEVGGASPDTSGADKSNRPAADGHTTSGATATPAGDQTAAGDENSGGSDTTMPAQADVDPEAHTHSALLQFAKDRGVVVNPKASKAKIAAAINAAKK